VCVRPRRSPCERTEFLLRELQALFRANGLLDAADVVVVAAREAYLEYLRTSAYVCQSGRTFTEGLTHLGFYADRAIQPEIARIRHRMDALVFSEERAERLAIGEDPRGDELADLIRTLLAESTRAAGEPYQVFLLSSPTDPDTGTFRS